MFTENHPSQIQTFFSGANYDNAQEIVFSNEASGVYLDAHNMEPTSNDGKTGKLNKIKGEQLLYANTGSYSGYECVGSIGVNNYLVEFWGSTTGQPGIIRVDGVVVLSSVGFNITKNNHLQLDKSESSYNEVFVAGRGITPFVFDVADMVSSVSTDKYFTAFDAKLYNINVQSALDMPMFIELVNVGGGGGGPVGNYQYELRYSTVDGDKTSFSQATPMIPIPQSLSTNSREYPWVKTYGSDPNTESVTSFAPKIRFRVTNLYNYDYIEIKRTAYNQGAGITFTPNGKIVAKIAIAPGEISVKDYIDFQESNVNIDVSETDQVRQLAHIKSAGSVKYYDRRLVFSDIEVESKEADPTFIEINGEQGFPVIDTIGQAGHKDPWNAVYRRSEMRGEKAGFAVNFYDCVGNSGYASKIPDLKDYQFPNRRDPISTNTENYSFDNVVKAATTAISTVDSTHEVFDLGEAVAKAAKCDFKNIIERGRITGTTGTKVKSPFGVNWDCDETNAEIENHGARVDSLSNVSTSYQPFRPVGENDTDVTGHNFIVNTKVSTENIFTGPVPVEDSNVRDYTPVGFAPRYFSMGMMIGGVDNIPEWAKAFSIVRTPSAGRVVCQGLAYYSMIQAKFNAIGNDNLGGKETNKFWFYSPDIDHGIVSSETLNDIIDNPQNYQLQFVSPLGFFSEYYSAEDNLIEKQRDRCVDMISYVRMIRDLASGPLINPGESSGFGISGSDGFRYVDYQLYRNTGSAPTSFSGTAEKGNRYFSMSQVKRKSEGRGNYIEITTEGDVYANVYPGDVTETNFGDAGNKNFTEPIYVVNIVRTGASVKDTDAQGYMATSHYQKLESIIGKSNGQANQSFPLVDERWEDCIPAPDSTRYGASTDRYLYVKLANGTVQKWLNVTFKTTAQINAIKAAISFTGTYNGDVYGVYTHTNVDDQSRFWTINFDVTGSVPPAESFIMVRYDKTAPIRVFGGDTFIGESIFAPIDRQASARDDAAENQFAWGNGLPYKTFKINPRYYTIRKAGASINAVQDKEWFTLGYIRQLCVMFTCESRSAIHLAYNGAGKNQFFPQTNYVIRPNRWDVDKTIIENHIFDDYVDDYGSDEKDIWKWGGFRFIQNINPDYSSMPPVKYFSKPAFGTDENTIYHNRSMWSLRRGLNNQVSPGLKTFPANNSYDIEDGRGRINYLWIDNTDKGDNIYAICEGGICLMLTRKTILSDLNGGDVGYMAADRFIGGEYWISKSIGCPGYLWHGIAENEVPVQLEGGAQAKRSAIFFPNNESIYRLMGNEVIDIGRMNYHSKLYKKAVSFLASGNYDKLSAFYDVYKQQYYLTITIDEETTTFVFSQKNNTWIGTNAFDFQKYTSIGNKSYGHRDSETFELNVGYEINGEPIEAVAVTASAPDPSADKEFIRWRLNASKKPFEVAFFKSVDQLEANTIQCSVPDSRIKDYGGYEYYVPRINTAVDVNEPRFQERLIITRIIHNLAEEFSITDFAVQYKKIKT